MNLKMGSQLFLDVQIPLLWGERAVVQDRHDRLSVIDLSGETARLEIVGDKPAPDVEFSPCVDGFEIHANGKALYRYSPDEKTLTMIDSHLPECQVGRSQTRVGSNLFSGNMVVGLGVGILVTETGTGMGAPLPPKLAMLAV